MEASSREALYSKPFMWQRYFLSMASMRGLKCAVHRPSFLSNVNSSSRLTMPRNRMDACQGRRVTTSIS